MKIFGFFLLFLILFFVASCGTTSKLEAMKPEPDDATPLVYTNANSFINMPILIKLKDIENKTNSLLNGLIYEDNDLEDDDIEMKVWKLSPIIISNKDGKIKTVLPLKVQAKYRYG